MTDAGSDNRVRHMIALVAGVVALAVLFAVPGGVASYLVAIGAGIVAVLIGHRSVRLPGPLLWAAILGLVFAYLELLVSSGLLLVRLTRIFTT